jgi:hypothetical protein
MNKKKDEKKKLKMWKRENKMKTNWNMTENVEEKYSERDSEVRGRENDLNFQGLTKITAHHFKIYPPSDVL